MTGRYVYASPVLTSRHVAYLRPRALPYQYVSRSSLDITPVPTGVTTRVDYFGNHVDQFQILSPHAELHVSAHSVVEVVSRFDDLDGTATPTWETVKAATARADLGTAQFLYASPYTEVTPEILAYARRSFGDGVPVMEAALDLTHRIHEEFVFDPSATTIATPVSRVLAGRRGVCQDFAHFQISCLRALGLAARYVSGYILTDPPKGQPRLIGADASHAWLSLHVPGLGWVDLDPTNDLVVGSRHVTLAWGRDYGDVSPLRGVLLGGEEHTLYVGVSVIPEDELTQHGFAR